MVDNRYVACGKVIEYNKQSALEHSLFCNDLLFVSTTFPERITSRVKTSMVNRLECHVLMKAKRAIRNHQESHLPDFGPRATLSHN